MSRSDTPCDVQKFYDDAWRNLSPEERFLKGLELIRMSLAMRMAGFRYRFPDYSDEQLKRKMIQSIYECE